MIIIKIYEGPLEFNKKMNNHLKNGQETPHQ